MSWIFLRTCLDVEILSGHHVGRRAFLPRIKHKMIESTKLPFIFLGNNLPQKSLLKKVSLKKRMKTSQKNVIFKKKLSQT